MRKLLLIIAAIVLTPFVASAVQVSVPSAASSGYGLVSTSTGNYLSVPFQSTYPVLITANSSGINYSLLNMATTTATCSGTVSCTTFTIIGGSPITITGSASGSGTVGTSTIPTVGQLAYWTSAGYPSLLGSVATSTLTPSSPLTGSFVQIGSSGSLGCQTASGSQAGCLSSSDWTNFNNKVSSSSLAALYPFTVPGNATSTLTQFNGGLTAYASSTIGNGGGAPALTVSGNTIMGNSGAGPTLYITNAGLGGLGLEVIQSGFSNSIAADIENNSGGGTALNLSDSGGTALNVSAGKTILTYASTTAWSITSTSTGTSGINLSGGCFAISGTCLTSGGSGTVTSVTASTPNSTLSLGGTNPITTSGTISFDLNLGHSNWWTARQNFTNASTSLFEATSSARFSFLSGAAAGNFLAVDPNGYLIATSSPSGSNSAFSPAANYATTGTLPAYTYAAGVITEVSNGALSVDGANPSVGQIVLVKNESGTCTSSSGGCNNGLYNVTVAGSGIAAFVLTRNSQYNSSSNVIPGIITYVISGTVNNDDFWAMTSAAPITIGTTALTYTEVSGGGAAVTSVSNSDSTLTISPTAGAVVASLNLSHANTWSALQNFGNATSTLFTSTTAWIGTLNLTNPLTIGNGGTGLTSVGASSTVATTNGTSIAWQKLDLGAAVYGILPIANGGTNDSGISFPSNGFVAYNGTQLGGYSNYTLTSGLATLPNASTTNFTAGSSNMFLIGSTGEVSGYDAQTITQGQISPMRYLSFQLGTSTTWTATSSATSALGDTAHVVVPFTGTIRTLSCATSAGTLEIEAELNSINSYFPASTTAGTYTYSNAFTKGQIMTVVGGAPATAPTYATCTMGATQTP